MNLLISVSAREPWKTDYGTQSLPETDRQTEREREREKRGDLNFSNFSSWSLALFPLELTKLITRHGGRNDVSSRLLPNCSTTLANRASTIDTVTDRKWAGPTSPRLYTTARDSCWVSKTNCANCHGSIKAREEKERSKMCSLPGRWLLHVRVLYTMSWCHQ